MKDRRLSDTQTAVNNCKGDKLFVNEYRQKKTRMPESTRVLRGIGLCSGLGSLDVDAVLLLAKAVSSGGV